MPTPSKKQDRSARAAKRRRMMESISLAASAQRKKIQSELKKEIEEAKKEAEKAKLSLDKRVEQARDALIAEKYKETRAHRLKIVRIVQAIKGGKKGKYKALFDAENFTQPDALMCRRPKKGKAYKIRRERLLLIAKKELAKCGKKEAAGKCQLKCAENKQQKKREMAMKKK